MRAEKDTSCCIAGGGPAGMMLGLLLARAGVPVTVLEQHADFLRDFRGDTIHPSTLQVLDELGLAAALLALPHRKAPVLRGLTDAGWVTVADLRTLPGRYQYIAFAAQWDFLNLLAEHARRYPHFTLRMNAEVTGLLRDGERIAGVRYRADNGHSGEVRAALTVAADGRSSAVCAAAGLAPVRYGAPMDVLWFRLPRTADDPDETFGRLGDGRMLVLINRQDYWQMAYLIPKGSYQDLRAADLDTVRQNVAALLPWLAGRVGELSSWDALALLEVQVARLRRWHLPGLLAIGDAAHAMSPIAGVGINLAIQDAVAAANALAMPLRAGTLGERHLRGVQRRRAWPAVVTQTVQRIIQRRVISRTLRGRAPSVPLPARLAARAGLGPRLAARFIGIGVRPEHVRDRRPTGRPPRA